MSQIIEIVVSPSGQTQLKTSGFSGASCQAASQPFERALGIKESEQLTAEFYAQQSAAASLRQGN